MNTLEIKVDCDWETDEADDQYRIPVCPRDREPECDLFCRYSFAGRICEPAVIQAIAERDELKTELKATEILAEAYMQRSKLLLEAITRLVPEHERARLTTVIVLQLDALINGAMKKSEDAVKESSSKSPKPRTGWGDPIGPKEADSEPEKLTEEQRAELVETEAAEEAAKEGR